MSQIECVCLFDIDGTLLSSGGAGKHAMYAAIASEFGVANLDDGVPFAGRTDRAIARDLLDRHGLENSDSNFRRFVRAYLGHLPHSLATHPGRVLPGVAELLTTLRQRGDVAVGLLTGNLRDGATSKLRHYAIDHFFSFGGFGDHHLDRDDVARDALAEVARHVRPSLARDRIWVLGDTPLDVRCARAIGAKILAVCTGLHRRAELASERPDILLDDLSDAAAILAQFSA
jgi:phosphoglycolate phosphatase-like HAD superfamily hydrolase